MPGPASHSEPVAVTPERQRELYANGCVGLLFSLVLLALAGHRGLEGDRAWVSQWLGDLGAWLGMLTVGYVFIGLLKADMRATGVVPPKAERPDRDVVAVVFAPANVLHEYTHGLAALACGGRYERLVREDGRMGVDVAFPNGVRGSTVGLVATSLAPTLTGVVALVVLHDWAVAALLDPTVPRVESVQRIITTAYLVRYSWPSRADLQVPVLVTRRTVAAVT
jgi:hypothetical protein